MPYCQHCGNEVEHAVEALPVAAEAVSAEVEIARINAERDVAVARIQARQAAAELETIETVAEVEAEAQVETAVAEAEVIGEIIAAESESSEETEAPPMVITETPEPEDDLAPPETGHHEPAAPKSKGLWPYA